MTKYHRYHLMNIRTLDKKTEQKESVLGAPRECRRAWPCYKGCKSVMLSTMDAEIKKPPEIWEEVY